MPVPPCSKQCALPGVFVSCRFRAPAFLTLQYLANPTGTDLQQLTEPSKADQSHSK